MHKISTSALSFFFSRFSLRAIPTLWLRSSSPWPTCPPPPPPTPRRLLPRREERSWGVSRRRCCLPCVVLMRKKSEPRRSTNVEDNCAPKIFRFSSYVFNQNPLSVVVCVTTLQAMPMWYSKVSNCPLVILDSCLWMKYNTLISWCVPEDGGRQQYLCRPA